MQLIADNRRPEGVRRGVGSSYKIFLMPPGLTVAMPAQYSPVSHTGTWGSKEADVLNASGLGGGGDSRLLRMQIFLLRPTKAPKIETASILSRRSPQEKSLMAKLSP